jgi:hypothetical protein
MLVALLLENLPIPKLYRGNSTNYFEKSSGYINIFPDIKYNLIENPEYKIVIDSDDIQNTSTIDIVLVPYTYGKFEYEECYRITYNLSNLEERILPKQILYRPSIHIDPNMKYNIIYKR